MVKAPRRCSECSELGHDRRSCPAVKGVRKAKGKQFDPWLDLEWRDHLEVQKIVDEHPDGMTLEEVGRVLGVTRERVRQIEVVALRKLKKGDGDYEPVVVDGITIAVGECLVCGQPFPRQGRAKQCEACIKPQDRIKRPRRRNKSPVTPAGDTVPPAPTPDPVGRVVIIFDFGGWS